jgi:hypothetical protein
MLTVDPDCVVDVDAGHVNEACSSGYVMVTLPVYVPTTLGI